MGNPFSYEKKTHYTWGTWTTLIVGAVFITALASVGLSFVPSAAVAGWIALALALVGLISAVLTVYSGTTTSPTDKADAWGMGLGLAAASVTLGAIISVGVAAARGDGVEGSFVDALVAGFAAATGS